MGKIYIYLFKMGNLIVNMSKQDLCKLIFLLKGVGVGESSKIF